MAKGVTPGNKAGEIVKDDPTGHEKNEPGQAPRELDERAIEANHLDRETIEIAKQQGVTQRGWTADQENPEAPPHFDPAHPGGKPAGDPHH